MMETIQRGKMSPQDAVRLRNTLMKQGEYVWEIFYFGGGKERIEAPTKSKATYKAWKKSGEGLYFGDFLRYITQIKRLGAFDVSQTFEDSERFERVCRHRGIDFAYQGQLVTVCGEAGILVGANSGANFNVRFLNCVRNCHPTYETVYYGSDGGIVADYEQNGASE